MYFSSNNEIQQFGTDGNQLGTSTAETDTDADADITSSSVPSALDIVTARYAAQKDQEARYGMQRLF